MVPTRRSRVNMADIARESGVSLSTVSMVLSDKPGLPAETRQRVLNAAQALGYKPRNTQSNMHGRLRTVGLVIKSQYNVIPYSDQFYSYVVAGIEMACRQRGLNLLYATMSTDLDNRPLEIPGLVEKPGADGLLLVGMMIDQALVEALDQRGIPVVLVDAYCDDHEYDSVLSNNLCGAYQATEYLIRKGHRKIGFIGGFKFGYPSFRERRLGYQKALVDHQIKDVFIADCYSKREEATDAARAFFLQHPEITAVVGANDFITISAMHVIKELGLRVGDDISLVGFDDIILSENVMPPLTTMQVDKLTMGKLSVELLARRVDNPESSTITITTHPKLIERSSVKPVQRTMSFEPSPIASSSEG